ncbi:MAG: MFS transporter [Chlamydiales bacterium]|nr:MFS transporter [Chlamydiales bacterium]
MNSKEAKKSLIAASIGNALEWYDFGLYGFLATTIQKLFFPFQTTSHGIFSVFVIFAVGLFMRPLGGLIFGHIGDKIGRKTALIASIATMAIPTFLIGLLPTYASAGITATYLLIATRLLQGLAVGGEMIGAMIFLTEHAPQEKRGVSSCLVYSVGSLGGLLGAMAGVLAHTFFTEEELLSGGWRWPFLVGILIGGIGLYIRLKIKETPLFIKLQNNNNTAIKPFREAIQRHLKEIIIIFLLISFQATGFYLPFVYLTTWLTENAHFSSRNALLLNTFGIFLLTPLILGFAALSDKIGRRKILLTSTLCICALAYPLFWLLSFIAKSSLPFAYSFIPVSLFSLLTAAFQGPLAATLTELLTTKNRYMSLVIGYNTSAALFGGLTPLLSIYLVSLMHIPEAPSFLLIFTGLIAFFTILFFVKETFKKQIE